MKISLFFLLFFIFVRDLFAANIYMNAGFNQSCFRNVDNTHESGIVGGIGVEWPMAKANRLIWGIEIVYIQKKLGLVEKTWSREYINKKYELFLTNIDIDTRFIQMPVKVGINIPVKSNLSIRPAIGISAAVTVLDKSQMHEINVTIVDEEEVMQNPPDYQYIRFGDSNISSTIAIMYELQFLVKKWGVVLQFHKDLFATKTKFDITIEHPLDTIILCAIYYL